MNALRRITSTGTGRRSRIQNTATWPLAVAQNGPVGVPLKRYHTQAQQDEADDEQRREAMRDLVESWMDRLQLISVITTFFASTEASLLSITAPTSVNTSKDGLTTAGQIANVGLVGALVVHTNAAIISFLAAFFLIRYKLRVAKKEEKDALHKTQLQQPTPFVHDKAHNELITSLAHAYDVESVKPPQQHGFHPPQSEHETDPIPGPFRIPQTHSENDQEEIWSRNPHLVQVGPFQTHPPTHLLSRCHNLCIFLSALGFALALMGILAFAWDSMPTSVSASATFFMALCLSAGVVLIFVPDPADGKMSPNIYFTG
ncbi:hypothetical protein CPB83DRAFT_851982 [Crepidotus variabilis]|uniref:Uncharacterized protein n=1 Tax=Crepidotus variabilis TaxID=179855 RepID=A0A9P6EIU3_9AGAR|nr:hypothetical protein CPB83DRAFT_851982 [Crepidotus variabilis]